jgi:hypothetical protein
MHCDLVTDRNAMTGLEHRIIPRDFRAAKGWENSMFKTNEGTFDRVSRVIVGLGLVVWFFADQSGGVLHYAKLLGVVFVVTGLVGTCPIYRMLGVSTCAMRQT